VCRREGQFGDRLGVVKMGKRVNELHKRVVGRENNVLQHRKKRESESGKNRCKKIVMMKLIIQKKYQQQKSTRYRNNKKFSLLIKFLELFLRCAILVLAYKKELCLFSPGDWLVSSISFLYLQD
jgi:hypothetical protein